MRRGDAKTPVGAKNKAVVGVEAEDETRVGENGGTVLARGVDGDSSTQALGLTWPGEEISTVFGAVSEVDLRKCTSLMDGDTGSFMTGWGGSTAVPILSCNEVREFLYLYY